MSKYNIYGSFVDSAYDKVAPEDITPVEFKQFVEGIKDNEPLDIYVNSCGGSVTSGIAIANTIKSLKNRGIKTIAHIDGIAASIASVVVCSCEEIVFPKSSFMMIHNCWSIVQGNSNDLRREADVMDKMNKAIVSFYLDKFSLAESELAILMENETWICGKEALAYNLKCNVVDDDKVINNKLIMTKNFKNLPKVFIDMKKNEDIEKKEEEVVENTDVETEGVETEEEPTKEKEIVDEKKLAPTEEPVGEEEGDDDTTDGDGDTTPDTGDTPTPDTPATDECEETKDEDEEKVPVKECEKRVSGMQAKMQKKINALNVEYKNKINDLTNEIKVKDEELISVKAEVTSLRSELDESNKELSEKTSAFEEVMEKLASLNASVLSPSDVTDWRQLKGKAFFDYLKKNPQVTK